MQAFFRFGACGQVRRLSGLIDCGRRRMEIRGSGPNRFSELVGSASGWCARIPEVMQAFFRTVRCIQVLSSIRPHRLRQFRRRGPVWRYAGRVQIASASSSALRPGAGFPDPVSLTVCPYPSSALPASRTSMDAPGDASIFSYGSVHAVRCCRLSGLIDCGSSDAAGPYGDTRVGSKSLQRARRLCVRVLVFPTPSR